MPSVFVARVTLKPTLFRKQIKELKDYPQTGDWVWIYATDNPDQNEPFAVGLYNEESEIAVRIIRWFDGLPNEAFWRALIDRAVRLRTDILELPATTNAFRVIHGETDGFPGVVVDQYADVLSAEVFSFAMYQRMPELMPMIAERCGIEKWLVQPSPAFEEQEGFPVDAITSGKLPKSVVIHEDSTKYRVQFAGSHKTGFFCDQRENRQQLHRMASNKTVLDLCCYTGGFSIAAATGGATEVIGVDLDEAPLEVAKKNADINQVRVKFSQSDAFSYMRDLQRTGKRFNIVVCDPPKLIRSRGEYEEGRNKHFDLNRLAISLVEPGGLLLTCSCAGLLPEDEFIKLVRQAARATGFTDEGVPNPPRSCQILHRKSAPADHPVSLDYPESEYLKTLWVRVD
jgi:23S rRNA (cytosine1962-C5)-methyltransferase